VEAREITGIHVYGASGKGQPAVVLFGTIHAREWISTMVPEHHAFSLLTKYDTDKEIRSWVDKYDFYIFPVTNVSPSILFSWLLHLYYISI
jgi:carboxypeptidase A4